MRRLALLGVPSSLGAGGPGQERAPGALRAAGLLDRLRATGLDVDDMGDLPLHPFRPDVEHPKCPNLAVVVKLVEQVADRVESAIRLDRLPLVLGGDCSVSIGVVAGVTRRHERPGLVYLDGDADLNTPETTQSGRLDGMALAHIVGAGAPELAGVGPRSPLLREEEVVLFGYERDGGRLDPPEVEALGRSRIARFPSAQVRVDPAARAGDGLLHLEPRSDAILVHFDVDVTDSPAADVPNPQGLPLDGAFAALRVLLGSSRFAGLVLTELNPDRDPSGSETGRFVERLVDTLGNFLR